MFGKRFFVCLLLCVLMLSVLGCSGVPSIGPDDGYTGQVIISIRLGTGTTRVNIIEGDGARQLVKRLTAMKPTGKQEEKIPTDAQWTSGYYPAEETPFMTAWLETDSGIYRANLDKKTVCRVESHYAEGELLKADADFFEFVDVVSKYWPYHTDTCTYRDGKFVTERNLNAQTTVQIKVKDVELNKEGWQNKSSSKYYVRLVLEVESTVDQTVKIRAHPPTYGCVVYGTYSEEVEMKAGQTQEVRLPLASPGTWWTSAVIEADNTRIFLVNEDNQDE